MFLETRQHLWYTSMLSLNITKEKSLLYCTSNVSFEPPYILLRFASFFFTGKKSVHLQNEILYRGRSVNGVNVFLLTVRFVFCKNLEKFNLFLTMSRHLLLPWHWCYIKNQSYVSSFYSHGHVDEQSCSQRFALSKRIKRHVDFMFEKKL